MDGAVQSGERAAAEVLDAAGRRAVTRHADASPAANP
jgi:hypothetical protein